MKKKKLTSYALSSVIAVVLAGGCITPAYYSNQQDISLTIPEGATAEMDGKELEKRGNTVHATVDRSWRDKEITVKKEGYKDEKVKLKSVATKDKWAKAGATHEFKESASYLFIPIHTALAATAVVTGPIVTVTDPSTGVGALAAGLIALPVGIGIDLYNMVIGAPSAAIKNPWREYEYNGVLRKMEPIEQNTPSGISSSVFK